ncbi:Fc receptor-like protein 1 isoform X6 [Piliocolobus tephrosceles]|uniref:Fc receptor like 1 n=1 Tax=Piliocolobus tephrosceles TaxID=591936 RepID=A0A8C9H3G2_9PRIM|nr:Fc receptor-like protein 1 isoform X6 [Piliocolobus tephrosceles]
MLPRLLLLICAPLCEPAELLLIVSPSHPTEGSPVTLTCKMPSLQSSDAQFQFCFFRDAQALGPGWSRSPKLQIANMWKEDSGSYWCEAQTMASKVLRSWRSQINVHRVPVADVSLETQPPGGQTKTQRSLTAEYEIPTARESDAEQYYCVAENGYGPRPSGLVSITVRIPVSRPILMLRAPRAQAVVGDVLKLHCEALRGSHPILYWFYHEDVILGSSSAPSGGGASFNLSLTAEHSGNYSCEANNGLGAQRSEEVTLNFTVPPGARSNHLTSGVIEGLLGTLGPATVALLFCYGLKRKIGRRSTRDPLRSLPSPVPQEFPYLNSPTPGQLQPIYENVNVVSGHEVYSLVYYNQPEQESAAAETLGTHMDDQVSLDIYSRLRKANITDVDYEDAM